MRRQSRTPARLTAVNPGLVERTNRLSPHRCDCTSLKEYKNEIVDGNGSVSAIDTVSEIRRWESVIEQFTYLVDRSVNRSI